MTPTTFAKRLAITSFILAGVLILFMPLAGCATAPNKERAPTYGPPDVAYKPRCVHPERPFYDRDDRRYFCRDTRSMGIGHVEHNTTIDQTEGVPSTTP